MFLHMSVILSTGGMRDCSGGGACVVSWGACVVAPRGGACMAAQGACVVATGVMHGCSGGACVFAPGGHAWLLWGDVCGIRRDMEIRSMSGWYASYWNAFLLIKRLFARMSHVVFSRGGWATVLHNS